MVLITHDLGVVAGQADRVLVMYAGRPVEIGDVEDIYYRPRMPYTLGLLGSVPRLDTNRSQRLLPILGSPPSLVNLPAGCPFTPRCPIAQDRCESQEPALISVASQHHHAACHFSHELAGVRPHDLFAPTSADTRTSDRPGRPPAAAPTGKGDLT
jgi:peptide/nickel transport system ATP-binding protein